MTTWRSKLGKEFLKEEIERDEKKHKAELDHLRNLPENRWCADCGANGTVWASVNLGVFLCMKCGAHHRGMGTHVSLPKGCVGTYLWGPDEVDRMRSIGNAKAKRIYGGDDKRPRKNAPDSEWFRYIVSKYQNRAFAPGTATSTPITTDLPPEKLSPSSPHRRSMGQKTGLSSLPANKCFSDWAHFAEKPLQSAAVKDTLTADANHVDSREDLPDMITFDDDHNKFFDQTEQTSRQDVSPGVSPTSRSKAVTSSRGSSDFFSSFGL